MAHSLPSPGSPWAEFPGFYGTIKALRLLPPFPPHFVFLRLAVPREAPGSFAPIGPGAPRRAWSWSPGVSGREGYAWSWQVLPCSWGTPNVPLPCSPTPADRPHQALAMRRRGPHSDHKEGCRDAFARLNHTALALAVYALPGGSSHRDTRLASGYWPGSTGRAWLPAGFR